MSKFLEGLNDVQKEAVLQKEGASLVIAGAGSGKTRVLTYRIAYLLSQGVLPHQILALTFTNKAAREMKERIAKLVGSDLANYLWMGTFHSVFSRILRYEADSIGFPSSFTIYDTSDTKSAIKSVIKQLKLDEKTYKLSVVMHRISMAKNNLITASAYKDNDLELANDRQSHCPQIYQIYERYSLECLKSGAMDFDDLLLNTNILFHNNPDVLKKYQQKFLYVLVDEYQDTNLSQYLIIKKLCQLNQNICVVGDDAQSIYSFRGAKIENILNFKNDYPTHKLFKLEQNYRSTKTIVKAANGLIKKNVNQIPKEVFSENEEGELIKIISAYTDKEEGYLITNDLFEQMNLKQLRYEDIAILYRTNAQSRILEEALRKRNMPYKIYGGLSFYQRKEIKDLIAYFRMVVNSKDNEALKRIINYPARGIGSTTLEKIEQAANVQGVSFWQIIINPTKFPLNINAGTQKKIATFVTLIEQFKEINEKKDAYDTAREIANKTEILKDLYKENTVEERAKYENVEELLNGIRDFVATNFAKNEPIKLENFLENVALLTDQDNEKDNDKNKITLMTMHASKGLEFSQVYIVGMEEELFPSKMSVYSQQELEEERRLFYVAVTRAKKRLTMSYALSRYKYGVPDSTTPSRFLKDIDPFLIESEQGFGAGIKNFNKNGGLEFSNRLGSSEKKHPNINLLAAQKLKKINKITENTDFIPSPSDAILQGADVEHSQFGKGKVIQIEGVGDNRKARVFFSGVGEKKLLLKFARLKLID